MGKSRALTQTLALARGRSYGSAANKAIEEPAFEQQFGRMREYGRKKLQALIIGTIAILIVLVGTKLFGWAW